MKSINKIIMTLLLVALVSVSVLSIAGCNDKGASATLDKFMEQVNSGADVIQLTEDIIASDADVSIPSGTTIDLMGKTIDVKSFVMQSADSGEYTIKNGTIKSAGDIKVLMKNATINLKDVMFRVSEGAKLITQTSPNTLNIEGGTGVYDLDGNPVAVVVEEGSRVVINENATNPIQLIVAGAGVSVENNSNMDGNSIAIASDVGGEIEIINEGNLDSVENNAPNAEVSLTTTNDPNADPIEIKGSNSDAIEQEIIAREITFYNGAKSADNIVEMFVYDDHETIGADPVDWDFVEENEEFLGWYSSPNFEENSKIVYPYTVTGDADWFAKVAVKTEINAKFSVYLHNLSGGAFYDIVIDKVVKIGEDIVAPTAEELDLQGGWEVTNWINGADVATFPMEATTDVEFYAELKNETLIYDVDFMVGNSKTTISAYFGEQISAPDVEAEVANYGEGFYLEGWTISGYNDQGEPTQLPAVFPYTVVGLQTFTADLSNKYTVEYYDTDNKTVLATAELSYGNNLLESEFGFDKVSVEEGTRCVGWSLSVGGDAIVFPYAIEESVKLYPIVEDIVLNVTFINENETLSSECIVYGAEITKPTDPIKEGYTLVGWIDNSITTQEEIAVFPYVIKKDTTFEAKWEINEYTVTFNNGEETSTLSREYNTSIEESDCPSFNPPSAEQELAGWYTSATFEADTKITFPYTVTEDVQIYAKWQEINLNPVLTISANGGAFAGGESAISYDPTDDTQGVLIDNGDGTYAIETYNIPMPIREGNWMLDEMYGYINLYATEDCTGDPIDLYSFVFTAEESVTIYANWLEAVTIKLNANYGMVHDNMFYLGYDMYQPNYSNKYIKGTYVVLEYVDLEESLSEVVCNSSSIHIPYLWRHGYTMAGWSYDEAGNNMVDFTSPIMVEEDISLYLQWTKLPEFTFINGAETTVVEVYENDWREIVVDLPNEPTAVGKSFYGWWEENGTTADYATDFTTSYNALENVDGYFDGDRFIPTEYKTYYARFLDKEVTLNYDANGGEFANGGTAVTTILSRSSYADTLGAVSILADTHITESVIKVRTSGEFGEKCIGWSLTAEGGALSTQDINETLHNQIIGGADEITLYAVWEIYGDGEFGKKPMVIFDGNGGIFDGKYTQIKRACYQTSTYEDYHPASLTDTFFNLQREGYRFVGWYTADGTDDNWGTPLKNKYGSSNVSYSWKAMYDDIVYARWESEDICPHCGNNPCINSTACNLPTYTYDANGGMYYEGATTYDEDVVWYVDYKGIGCWYTNAHTIENYIYRPGCIFLGWYSLNGGESTDDADWGELVWSEIYADAEFSNKPTEDRTYYARWEKGATYIFDANGGKIVGDGIRFYSVDIVYCDVQRSEYDGVVDYYLDPHLDSGQICKSNGDILVGWFTQDGTNGEWGQEVKFGYNQETGEDYPTELIDRTLYAKWVAFEDLLADWIMPGGGIA